MTKRRKTLITLLISAILLMSFSGTIQAEPAIQPPVQAGINATESGNRIWTDPDCGAKYIIRTDGKASYVEPGVAETNVIIPATIKVGEKTLKVAEVMASAFDSNQKIMSVEIGKYVETIGDCAFQNCQSLTFVDLGGKITKIGANTFNGCVKLKSFTGAKKVKSIGDSAFCNCKALISATFSSKLTEIGVNAFYNCKKMTEITGLSKLKTIGKNAFKKCASLTSFTIPASVTFIGANAFSSCTKLKTITIKSTKLTSGNVGSKAFDKVDKKAVFKCPKGKAKDYEKLLVKKGAPATSTFK